VFSDGLETLELVAGARRLAAARICDATIRPFPTLRTEIRDLTDEEAERLSLIENLQRENLTPLEEGYRYTHLQRRDPSRWSVRAIADFVHKKKSTIQNRLNLVRDLAVAEAVLSERIPPTAGFHIMRLPPEMRATYLAEAVRHGLTVEQVRADVDRRITILRATPNNIETVDLSGTQPEPDAHATSPNTLLPGDADATPTSRTVHLRHLRAQRVQVGLRIDELEAELRRHVVAFRELSVEIAKVDGFHD
jgi:ParB-like chromosome segregation protein Spo0J